MENKRAISQLQKAYFVFPLALCHRFYCTCMLIIKNMMMMMLMMMVMVVVDDDDDDDDDDDIT